MNLYQLINYIKNSKTVNQSLAVDTPQKMDQTAQEAVIISGDITANELSLADFNTAITESALNQGNYYLVSGCQAVMYGGTTLLLQATSENTVSSEGYGLFYNPLYATYSVWDPGQEYTIGSIVIYGGQCWSNNTGSVGTTNDGSIFQLDNTNWTLIPAPNATYYAEVWDKIEYDVVDDYIISRFEAITNNLVRSSVATGYWFFCGIINPIMVFQWGNPFNGSVGNTACQIVDSYFNNLNIINGAIVGVNLSQYSYVMQLTMSGGSYINGLTMNNYSFISTLSLASESGMCWVSLNNESSISNCSWTGSGMWESSLNNYSQISNMNMTSSGVTYISLNNESGINAANITNSGLSGIDLTNYSYFGEITMGGGSGLYDIKMDNSQISGSTIESSSYLESIFLNDSVLNGLNTGAFSFTNVELTGIQLDYYNSVIESFNFNGIYGKNNFVKFNFPLYFNGTGGKGIVGTLTNIPFIPINSGWFIEQIIVQSTNGGYSSSSGAILNLGLASGGDGVEALNNTTGLFATITSSPYIFYYNVANGSVVPTLSGGTNLGGAVATANIDGGTLYFELTIRNLNNNFEND